MKFKLTLTNTTNGKVIDIYRIVTDKTELCEEPNNEITELTTDELSVPSGSLYLSEKILCKIKEQIGV